MDRRGSANPTRWAVASILLGVLVVGGGSRAADPPAAKAENRLADDVVRWTAMLGSDRFDRRQAATRQLIGAGEEALPPLVRAVYSEDLEVRYRAFYILQFAAQTKETHKRELARKMLKQLAAADQPSVAQLAARALREIVQQSVFGLQQKGARLRWENHQLQSVRLTHGRIADDDLRCLRELSELKELDLRFTATITNSTLEHIADLAHLEVLKTLHVEQTKLSTAGLEELRRTLSHVRVIGSVPQRRSNGRP